MGRGGIALAAAKLELSSALKSLAALPRGGKLMASELFKAFRSGAALILTRANSPSSLRSLPARIILLDEVRVLLISTPTEKGLSRIERLYEATDRRRYHVPCPHCANWITLEFEQLYLELAAAYHRCQTCAPGSRRGKSSRHRERRMADYGHIDRSRHCGLSHLAGL
jgi:phage terminase large subunit GpA-like protein